MRFCKNCGLEIGENDIYCSRCGVNQNEPLEKKENFFQKVKNKVHNYLIDEVEDTDSLVKFISSSLRIGFILLAVYAGLSVVIDIFDFFTYLFHGPFIDFIVTIPCMLAALVVLLVSIRGAKEMKKLGNQALEDESARNTLMKLFSGGIVAVILIFLVFLS